MSTEAGPEKFWRLAISWILFIIGFVLLIVSMILGTVAGIPAAGCIVLGLLVAKAKGSIARIVTKATGLLVILFFAYMFTLASTISFSH